MVLLKKTLKVNILIKKKKIKKKENIQGKIECTDIGVWHGVGCSSKKKT